MAQAYCPDLDNYGLIGDAANPLVLLQHRHRHSRLTVRPREGTPLDEHQRDHLLSRHCQRRGRRHDWSIQTRDGVACLWCGIVKADVA